MHAGKLTREEIKEMLRVRAQRIEVPIADYERYLENPTPELRREMAAKATAAAAEAYKKEAAKETWRCNDKDGQGQGQGSPTSVSGAAAQ